MRGGKEFTSDFKMAELPHIGQHCSVVSCKQLDFLPFKCNGCDKVYCQEHRSREHHECSERCIPANTVEYTGPKGFTCSLEACSNRELTPIICDKCSKSFCLSHRHQKDHKCEKLKEEEPVSQTAQHVQKILDSKGKILPPKHRGAKNPKTAAKVALMKLKQKARGDKGIPEVERIYFSVQLPNTDESRPLFFSKKWTVGRVIDYAASVSGVTNVNNTGADKKLRLFAADTGGILPVETSLGSILDSESQIYNGSTVILEIVSCGCVHI